MGSMKKVYFPTTRLSELANQGGGVTRSSAIEGAMQQLESMRAESDSIIEKAIVAIEEVALKPQVRGKFNNDEKRTLLRQADQVVTLAGTFGYTSLDAAAKSMCDVVDGMLTIDQNEAAPILVHVQAVRLMAPSSAKLGESETQKILSELNKILLHFNFTSLGDAAGDDQGLPNVA